MCCAQYFKDTIQKQFTTWLLRFQCQSVLCSIFQRYNSKAIHNTDCTMVISPFVVLNISKIQFKSNSQPFPNSKTHSLRCAQYFKDTIQKQFTTFIPLPCRRKELCSIFQRYNSKAIHNCTRSGNTNQGVVLNISKIQFKSNSQLDGSIVIVGDGCAQYFKDTIQKQFTTVFSVSASYLWLCSIFQRYNSKAIHNVAHCAFIGRQVVLNISKIQFKSNSQLSSFCVSLLECCAQYFKDTIQKQFTTPGTTYINTRKLCSIFQRYNSKAIHN